MKLNRGLGEVQYAVSISYAGMKQVNTLVSASETLEDILEKNTSFSVKFIKLKVKEIETKHILDDDGKAIVEISSVKFIDSDINYWTEFNGGVSNMLLNEITRESIYFIQGFYYEIHDLIHTLSTPCNREISVVGNQWICRLENILVMFKNDLSTIGFDVYDLNDPALFVNTDWEKDPGWYKYGVVCKRP